MLMNSPQYMKSADLRLLVTPPVCYPNTLKSEVKLAVRGMTVDVCDGL